MLTPSGESESIWHLTPSFSNSFLAVAELEAKFYKDGEITVKTDLKEIGSVPGPHEAYMSYEIYDNFYDGYTDPFGMTDDDYKKMTITMETSARYRISYTDDQGGKFSAVFVKKSWDMWAMGAMSYTTANGITHSMTSSSTDYEYVLRIGADTPISFRSGNHGNYPISLSMAQHRHVVALYPSFLMKPAQAFVPLSKTYPMQTINKSTPWSIRWMLVRLRSTMG